MSAPESKSMDDWTRAALAQLRAVHAYGGGTDEDELAVLRGLARVMRRLALEEAREVCDECREAIDSLRDAQEE